jgi:hypothetical protein
MHRLARTLDVRISGHTSHRQSEMSMQNGTLREQDKTNNCTMSVNFEPLRPSFRAWTVATNDCIGQLLGNEAVPWCSGKYEQ